MRRAVSQSDRHSAMAAASCFQRASLRLRASADASTSTRSSPAHPVSSAAAVRRLQSTGTSTSRPALSAFLGRGVRKHTRIYSSWKAVTSPEGQQYFWNIETGETAWRASSRPTLSCDIEWVLLSLCSCLRLMRHLPQSPPAASAPVALAPEPQQSAAPQVTFPELEQALIDVPGVYLAKEAEQYRDVAFGDPFTDYLTAEIAAAQGAGNAERQLKLEKLRARLANPLIRQPPPFV